MVKKNTVLTAKLLICVLAIVALMAFDSPAFQSASDDILEAAEKGDMKKIRILLQQNPDLIHARNEEGETPQHMASKEGHVHIVEFLLSKGAEVNALNNADQNPLLYAAYHGKVSVVELLLDKGADIKQRDRYGRTVLHYPAREGHKDVVDILVKKGMDITVEDGMGFSPLRFAILGGYAGIMDIFVTSQALDVAGDTGSQALHLAAKQGKKDIVDLLIAEGASLKTKDDRNATLLHNAAIGGLLELSRRLIAGKAIVNDLDTRGRPPLHYAVKQGFLDIVKLLVENGADLDIRGKDGRTALHIAEDWGHGKIIELLEAKGATNVPRPSPKNPEKPWVGVTYISNDGFLIISNTKKVVVDSLIQNPYGYTNTPDKVFDDMVKVLPPFERIDLILFSHAHRDHYEPQMAFKFMMSHPETVLVGNETVVKELKEAAGNDFSKISGRVKNTSPEWGSISEKIINGVSIKMFPVNHAMPGQPYMTLAFILDMEGVIVLHMGDIYAPSNEEYFKNFQLQKLEIDLAFIDPFFLLDKVGRQMAQEFIKPRRIVPMHMREHEIEKYASALKNFYPNVDVFYECFEKKIFEDSK